MDTSSFIFEILKTYQMPAIFLGAFFFGEAVVLAAAFLAAHGLWSPWTIFWLSLLGTLASDALWFLYGHKLLLFFHRWEGYRRQSEKFLAALERLTGKWPYRSLIFIKAVYGMRILTIIYLSIRKVEFGLFLLYDAIGSALWLFVIIAFGWLAGKSADYVPILNHLEYAAAAIVFIIVVWRLIFSWISKRAMQEL